LIATIACLLWLNGCETQTKLSDLVQSKSETTAQGPERFPNLPDDPKSTGSIGTPAPGPIAPPPPPIGAPQAGPPLPDAVPKGLLGNDPNDDLNLGKKHFRAANFGLAERYFRRAVELHPRSLEAWVGLAASYDRLRRYDLADRAYDQATKISGPTAELLNNWGYSYMLRGDYRRARATLVAARAKDPTSPHIANNPRLLDESATKAKAIN
jgi:tetratricopeptide (TPR) repeat protein